LIFVCIIANERAPFVAVFDEWESMQPKSRAFGFNNEDRSRGTLHAVESGRREANS
jgi:hypothetical protein